MKHSFAVLVLAAGVLTLALLAAGPALSSPSAASAQTAKVTVSKSAALGTILVDGQGRTLYLFEQDRRGRSSCAGACATYWPPLLTHGRPAAGRGVKGSLLGLTRRADGTTQVTYAGHPLYRFVQDRKPGQTTGQDSHAFGAGWYVLSPAGRKIEKADRVGEGPYAYPYS
jgi:predicted lipoprotein with Yx(FWY)xxD motif